MKWVVLFLFGIFLIGFAGATIPTNCDSSTVAYWQMQNNLNDSFGSYSSGVWDGTSSYSAFKVGDAADMDGSSQIIIPATGISFASSFSIEMQIESKSPTSSVLIKKGDYKIAWKNIGATSGSVVATVGTTSISATNINSATPHGVALTWDAVSGILTLYIDGTIKDQTTLLTAANSGGNFIIGNGFNGLIDEVAIYNSALSNKSIALHYALVDSGKNYCDVNGIGGSSTTDTSFRIGGCTFEFNNKLINLAAGECSSGNASGYFYCDDEKNGWVTQNVGYGCSLGKTSYTLGDNFCCPAGMFCNATSGKFQCTKRIENCATKTAEASCNEIGCVWLAEDSVCSDGTRDYSCGYYKTNDTCAEDKFDLGKIGIGTKFCGEHVTCNNGEDFSIPYDKCGCEWYSSAPAGQHCQVKLVGSQIFYNPAVGQDSFECSNTYKLGKCKKGVQDVQWFSANSIINGFGNQSSVPQDCLRAVECNNGSSTRICGEPLIKLPMFSLFSLFASLIIIGLYYFFKDTDNFK